MEEVLETAEGERATMSHNPFKNTPHHTGHTKLPPIQEMHGRRVDDLIAGLEPGTRIFQLGQCSVFISPPYLTMGWHMSISHPKRYPTWDEIAKARYELLPDTITMAMILPPTAEYVNTHPNCFHLHQIPGESE